MFRIALTIAALFGPSLAAHAGPNDFFTEKVKDFGTVPHGPTLVHHFTVKNTSNETWVIGSVGVSCGCVHATAQSGTLKPGESTVVTANMDTRRFTGHKQVTVFVRFHQPRYEEVGVVVRAYGRGDFMMFPDTINFSQVPFGKETAAKTQVTLTTDPNWQVTGATCDSAFIIPEVKQIKRQGSEVSYEVTAKVRGDLPVGRWFTEVYLTTNNATMQKVRVPLNIEVVPAQASVAVSPSNISFGDVKKGDAPEQTIMIRGEKPFRITDIENGNGAVEAKSKSGEANTVHIVTMKLNSGKAGDVAGSVRIKTDAEKDHAVSVPFKASIRE